MYKYLIIIFFSLYNLSNADILKKLEIEGNNRISDETIKVYGEIELGKDYTNEDLNIILKNLYSTDFFEDINLSYKNSTLSLVVKEYPIINAIDLKGEDSSRIKKLILERVKLKSRESFISSKLNDDLILIKNVYASLGYNFAKVDVEFTEFSDDRINLIFKIDPGKRTYINKINFIGDKRIRDSRLRDIIVSEEKKFWKFLSKNTFFNQQNIELDKRLLLNYFKSLGYYDVQVLSSNAEIDTNNYSNLVFTINAGNRYRINKISTNIESAIDKNIFNSLKLEYDEYIGEYYSPFKIQKILEALDELISNNDLQFIEHSVNEIIENENIEVRINIYEGKKEFIERVQITGNTVTDEAVIRSELLLDEGDPFDKLKLDKSISKLRSRNIFGEIKTNVKEGTGKEKRIVEIDVEEKPTGEISAGAGIGTTGGSFAFSITENNWLGKGINLSTDLDISSETFSGGISVNDPNYKFTGNSLNYFIKNIKNDVPNSGFKNNIITSGFGTQFEQYKNIFLAPKFVFSYDDLKVESSASSSLQKQKGTFSDLTFDYNIINDRRDRAFSPTDGYLLNFNQALPIYADAPFIKNSIMYNKYFSFNENINSALKFYGATINSLNNEDVRISKRLKPGSRLRGFENGKIGPKDGTDFIGGNYVSVVNLEMSLPNLLPESTKTDVGLFFDIGNVWHVDYSDNIDDSNKIRSTIGINTNLISPVGPMSFIFSKNLSKANTDITESFNFRLGTTF